MASFYDQSPKLLADDDPRAALAVIADIPLDDSVEVTPLPRELPLAALMADNLYECTDHSGRYVVHIEACTHFRPGVIARQIEYIQAIATKRRLPVRSYLFLLTAAGVPEQFPETVEVDLGDYRATFRLRVVKLWEIPGERILALGRPAPHSWVPLTATTQVQEEQAARLLIQAKNRTSFQRTALLGGLRYGSKERILERNKKMTVGEILQESSIYWEIRRKAIQEGRQEGRQEGELAASRSLLQQNLTVRFATLPDWATQKLSGADLQALTLWNSRLFTAPTLDAVFTPETPTDI